MAGNWRKNVREIAPYVPGEQPKDANFIKLNANENPYPPSPKVQEVFRSFDAAALRRYPDANSTELRHTLAEHFEVGDNQVFLGNGSDDVLALCFQTFFCSDEPILFPDVTYSFYPVWCSLFRIPFCKVPLTADYRIDPQDYAVPNGGVILPNPNAPTGIGEGLEFVETLLQNNPDSIVIIDEAYIDFGGTSCLPLLEKYENLVVVQTMSKSRSLAGMRVGYAIASPELIAALEAVKNSYNSYTMDMLTLDAATASVKDDAYFCETCARVIQTRERSAQTFREMDFTVLPSQTNFLLVTHPEKSAKELFEKLRAQKIFVRYFNQPRVDNHLRVTIGTDDEMDKLFEALQSIM